MANSITKKDDEKIRTKEYFIGGYRVKLVSGHFWDLRRRYGSDVSLIPNLYLLDGESHGIIISDEVLTHLDEEMVEFIMYREAAYLVNQTEMCHSLEDELNADLYGFLKTGASVDIMRRIYQCTKEALDDFCGCFVRLWALRGEKKKLLIREKFINEHNQRGF